MTRQLLIPIHLLLFNILFLTGCGARTHPPQWIAGELATEGMICAVGASEPTFYKEDAKRNAAENARKELARSIRTEVRTIMLDVVTEWGSQVEEATVVQATTSITDAVIENSRIMEYWYDKSGVVSPRAGIMYALSCMPRKIDRAAMEERLNLDGGAGELETVGRSLPEIIDKMEQE